MRKSSNFKGLCLILMLAVGFDFVLTGCRRDDFNGGEDAVPYEIVWYMPNTPQPDIETVNSGMSEITGEKINASLKVEYIDWGSYDQKMLIKIASEEAMDLMYTSNWTNDYITGVNKGAFMEISMDRLTELAPNVLDGVPEKCWPAAYVNGKLYAIINTQVEGRTPGIIGYKKYFEKYGVDITGIKKMEDITPFLEKVKAGEPGIIPIEIDGTRPWFNDIALTYGMEVFSKENPAALYIDDHSTRVFNYFAAPETMAYLKLIRQWYLKGYIRQDAAIVKDYINDLKAGKIALQAIVVNPDTMANQAALWGVKGPDMAGQTFMKTFMGTGSITAAMTAISRTSGNPELCYRLYNLLYDKNDTKLFNMLNYGIEGRHYTRKGDVVTPVANSGYWVSCGWQNGSMFNSYRQSEEQPEWYPIGPEMNNSAQTSKVLGFSFNPEPVKTELAQCTFVVGQYYNGLFTGSVDPEIYLPEFLKKLNNAGADTVVAEMQKQIDGWKKNR